MNAHGQCYCSQNEGLSFQQACAAIGRGEYGGVYGPNGHWCTNGDSWYWEEEGGISVYLQPFRIILDPSKPKHEPPRSLTYEEALECEKVRIVYPDGSNEVVFSIPIAGHKIMHQRLVFDLAERRGYRMESVD